MRVQDEFSFARRAEKNCERAVLAVLERVKNEKKGGGIFGGIFDLDENSPRGKLRERGPFPGFLFPRRWTILC